MTWGKAIFPLPYGRGSFVSSTIHLPSMLFAGERGKKRGLARVEKRMPRDGRSLRKIGASENFSVLFRTFPYFSVAFRSVPYGSVVFPAVPFGSVAFPAVQFCSVPFSLVQFGIRR